MNLSMGCINSKGSSGHQGTDCLERESFRSNKSLKISFDEFQNEGCDASSATAALLVPSSNSTNDNANKCVSVISSEDTENMQFVPASAAANRQHLHINGRNVQGHSIGSPSDYDASAALAMDQWPPWLSAVAGDAIRGWSPRKAESFEKLEKIGHGTYSSVYRARDLDSGKIVALKKVRFANMDPESVSFMAREIIVLRRLDHPNIMKLEGLITSRSSCSLYLVFQYMDHDLLGLQAAPGVNFTEAQIKCYMRQLLCGLDHCHSHGVLHRDIKGANLLLDNKGNLRIGDFGLATIFNPRKRQPMTSRVVTLWYRPPELLLGSSEYGVGVDLWSAGCILAELFTGNPIMPGRTEVEQLHKIFKLCGSPSEEYWRNSKLPHATIFKPQQSYKRSISETFKDLPPSALALLEVLLAINPKSRGTASDALQSEFFTAEPLPCDPSSLPKYPPSKEFDAKFKNEGSTGRRGDTGKQYAQEANLILPSENKVIHGRYGNSEFQQQQTHRKSISFKYDADEYGNNRIDQPVETLRGVPNNLLLSNSSWTVKPERLGSPRPTNEDWKVSRPNPMNVPNLMSQRSFMVRGVQQFSLFGIQERSQSQWSGESFNGTSSLLKSESTRHLLGKLDYSQQNGHVAKEQLGYDAQRKRIHCSGPLLPLRGNTYDMPREHERQVQREVRRDRNGKVKMSRLTRGDTELDESLLPYA